LLNFFSWKIPVPGSRFQNKISRKFLYLYSKGQGQYNCPCQRIK